MKDGGSLAIVSLCKGGGDVICESTMENPMIMSRSCLSILIFSLLLYSLLPVTPCGWAMDRLSGPVSAGCSDCVSDNGGGSGFGEESSEDGLDDCVLSSLCICNDASMILPIMMNVVPSSALLAFCLFHPPVSSC